MSLLSRLFSRREGRDRLRPLYDAVVAEARDPIWYRDLGVADTIDGRFDMVAGILALVLIRLETQPDAGAAPAALLTETFVDDMDGQLRQDGIGDVVVGKHVGRMVSALGGRLAVYRARLDGSGDLEEALVRNLYRSAPPAVDRIAAAAARFRAIHARLATLPIEQLIAGRLG